MTTKSLPDSLTDRNKIEFLRQFMQIGHTDGTPFEDACITVVSGRSFNLFGMKEVQEMLNTLETLALLGGAEALDPCHKFVYRMFVDNGIINGFSALHAFELELKEGLHDN